MKISILLGVVCLCGAAHADETPTFERQNPFSDVSPNHWSMSALQKLGKIGIVEGFDGRLPIQPSTRLTRYEFAVVTARIVDKYGYDPKFAPRSGITEIDAANVRDILVALLFEYRDEYMTLSVTDPMKEGAAVIDAYFADKEEHRALNASDWYFYAESQPWRKEVVVRPKSIAPRLVAPPHLTIKPSILHFQQTRPEFREVPRDYWAYAATRKAAQWILPEKASDFWNSGKIATHYEFAVAIARMEQTLLEEKSDLDPSEENAARDIVAALHREFETDVSRLQARGTFLESRPPTSSIPTLHGNDLEYLSSHPELLK